MIPVLLLWIRSNWKPVVMTLLIAAVIAYHKIEVQRAWYAGRAALQSEQKAEAQRRDDNANAADVAARECARDPDCRLRNDGHRRD